MAAPLLLAASTTPFNIRPSPTLAAITGCICSIFKLPWDPAREGAAGAEVGLAYRGCTVRDSIFGSLTFLRVISPELLELELPLILIEVPEVLGCEDPPLVKLDELGLLESNTISGELLPERGIPRAPRGGPSYSISRSKLDDESLRV